MRVLITGGMGVIGSMVSTLFVQEGDRPVIMGRHLDRSLIRLIEDKVDIEIGDILDLPRLLEIIRTHTITHIIHTAALLSDLSNRNPPQSIAVTMNPFPMATVTSNSAAPTGVSVRGRLRG